MRVYGTWNETRKKKKIKCATISVFFIIIIFFKYIHSWLKKRTNVEDHVNDVIYQTYKRKK